MNDEFTTSYQFPRMLSIVHGGLDMSKRHVSSSYRLQLTREGSDAAFVVEGHADGTLSVTRPGATT